jgi:hypothetical protein
MAVKYTKWPQNIPTSSIASPAKIGIFWQPCDGHQKLFGKTTQSLVLKTLFRNLRSPTSASGLVCTIQNVKNVLHHYPASGANPTTLSYNASVVKICTAINSMARFTFKIFFFSNVKTL